MKLIVSTCYFLNFIVVLIVTLTLVPRVNKQRVFVNKLN